MKTAKDTTMKNIRLIFACLLTTVFTLTVVAQTGPPDPPGDHGELDDQPPGGQAPIGGGLLILLGLAAGYGGRKFYLLRKQSEKI